MKTKERVTQAWIHLFFLIVSLFILIPFIVMVSSSFTADSYLKAHGYQLFPVEFSLDAYLYLVRNAKEIFLAYGISILITVIGTVLSVVTVAMMAYPLSLKSFRYRKLISFFLVFAMLFNGGLVPSYIMYTQYFGLKDSLLALLFPSLFLSPFNVILVKNYYQNSIPGELMDAALVDGAGQVQTLFQIVLPLAKPILATIGIMQALTYWNDWFNGMLYITNRSKYSIQMYLNEIQRNVEYLSHSTLAGTIGSQIQLPEVSIRMAIAVIAVLPMIIAYPFIQKWFVKGISAGAVKG